MAEPVVLLVTYSFPPESVPAAHRPGQLSLALRAAGRRHVVYSKFGVLPEGLHGGKERPSVASGVTRRGMFHRMRDRLVPMVAWLADIDRAFVWGLRLVPRLIRDVRRLVRGGEKVVLWATCPGITNLYVASIAAWVTGAPLHVDIRDAVKGVNHQRMPLMTRFALRMALSVSVVTPSLLRFMQQRVRFVSPTLILNGIARSAVTAACTHSPDPSRPIRLTYAGAVYGGDRPVHFAIDAIAAAVERFPDSHPGVELWFIGREDLSGLASQSGSERVRLRTSGALSKEEALAASAQSDLNLILVGSAEEHRCGIPLKTFDLLGIGRPILLVGPGDSDAALFLADHAGSSSYLVDTESGHQDSGTLAPWLLAAAVAPSQPVSEPSADSASRRIIELLDEGISA